MANTTKYSLGLALIALTFAITLILKLFILPWDIAIFLFFFGLNLFIKINYRWWLILALTFLSLIPASVYKLTDEPQAAILGQLTFLSLALAFVSIIRNKYGKKYFLSLPSTINVFGPLKKKLVLGLILIIATIHLILISPSLTEIIFMACLVFLFIILVSKKSNR